MAIYEYRCKKCSHEYEQRRSMADMDKRRACPECRSRAVERKLNMSFAVVGISRGGGDFDLGDFGGMEGMDGMDGMDGMPGGMPPRTLRPADSGMPEGLGGDF